MKFKDDKKVLIVDDDPQMRETLTSYMRKFGLVKIFEAPDVNEAKRLLVESVTSGEPFHLVLCDHHMDQHTGLDFISYIRMSLRFSDVPFITVTSDSSRPVVLPYISAGADSFIVKPVIEKDLYNKIAQVWTKRGLVA